MLWPAMIWLTLIPNILVQWHRGSVGRMLKCPSKDPRICQRLLTGSGAGVAELTDADTSQVSGRKLV